MKNKSKLLAVLGGLALTALAYGTWQAAQTPVVATVAGVSAKPLVQPSAAPIVAQAGMAKPALNVMPAPVIQAPRASVPIPTTIDQSMPAEKSMAWAREHGDDRAPPITRVAETDEPPTPAEVADPQLYAKYEKRQASKGYAAYVQAVNDALPVQEDALQQAIAKGITPEQLAMAQEKIRQMQQVRDQVLSQHPEIAQQ